MTPIEFENFVAETLGLDKTNSRIILGDMDVKALIKQVAWVAAASCHDSKLALAATAYSAD